MNKKTKIYQFTDHSVNPTAYCYVRASSQKEVAEITNKVLSHIKPHLRVATGNKEEEYRYLKHGEFAHSKPQEKTKGMSTLDLERIASIGYIKSARLTLDQCDLQDPKLKERLRGILGELDELRMDVSERLESKYSGR